MDSREGNSSLWWGAARLTESRSAGLPRGSRYETPSKEIILRNRQCKSGAGDKTVTEQNDIQPQGALRAAEQPVEKPPVSQALRGLAAEAAEGRRSETAQFREILDDVEHALNAGASHAEVLKTLHDHGFTMTKKSFESTLYRLRKERRQTRSGGVRELARRSA